MDSGHTTATATLVSALLKERNNMYIIFYGGSWICNTFRCKTTFRRSHLNDYNIHNIGFRLIKKFK